MLGNVGSTPHKSTSFVSWPSQCGYLWTCLLDRLPAIFDGGEVGQIVAVEVEFQPIWLLPRPYCTMFDLPSPWPESPSSSKTKFLMRFNPGLHDWLKNLGQCRPLTHLPVGYFPSTSSKHNIRFEIVAHRSPTGLAFFFLSFSSGSLSSWIQSGH